MDSKYHSQWNSKLTQYYAGEGHTWLLHSSHQALLLELDFKILGRVLLIMRVKCLECAVFSVTAMIPNLMLHVHSNTSFITPAVMWSSRAPLSVPHYLLKSFLSHQPFIPSVTQHFTTIIQPVSSLGPVICCIFLFLRSLVIYEMVPISVGLVSLTQSRRLIGWWDLS